MSEGAPVVAYTVGGLRRTVGEVLPQLLAPPGDLDGLVERVRSVLADPQPHVAAIDARRAWLAQTFGADACLPALERVYRTAVAGAAA